MMGITRDEALKLRLAIAKAGAAILAQGIEAGVYTVRQGFPRHDTELSYKADGAMVAVRRLIEALTEESVRPRVWRKRTEDSDTS